MIKSSLFAVLAFAVASTLFAGEWKNLSEDNWLSGRKLKPSDLRRKVVVVVDWSATCPDCGETLAFIQKNALGQKASGHSVEFIASHRAAGDKAAITAAIAAHGLKCPVYQGVEFSSAPGSEKLPFIYVLNAASAVMYAGSDKNDAVVAMVDAITEMPIPGQIINGVVLKKFKAYQKKLVMGVKAEGAALAPFKAALKSRKSAEVEEAQSVLDAIEKAKQNLADEIKEALDAGDKGMALRNIRWFCKSWPSEQSKFADDFKKLAVDPEAVAGEKKLLAELKKRSR